MPANKRCAIVHGEWVAEKHRGKGVGSACHLARLRAMAEVGYSTAICTVRCDNKGQHAIMRKFGWIRVTAASPSADLWVKGLETVK